ncbi:MAG: VWA domain-containing protein [Deltaproteobacteria bacterium]|nr:VWA domain-containing protein [Deltaproteobacteria bacterium]
MLPTLPLPRGLYRSPLLLLLSALAVLAPQGCRGTAEDLPATGPIGPPLAAPVLIPARLLQPEVELPQVSWPSVVPATVDAPGLERPALVRPALLDPYQVDLYRQQVLVVDVLWVVDNSGSMANERERLATSFAHFIRALQQRRIDYHVGVISTQVEGEGHGGELRPTGGAERFIVPRTPDAVRIFAEMVDFPPGNEREEPGLEAMRLALSEELRSGANRGFLRQDSALAVIVVSDEDDGSFGEAAHFARFLRHTRQPGDELLASFSAIAGLPPAGCTPAGEEHVFGAAVPVAERYLEVVELTGGLSGSICDTDFDPILAALGQRVGKLTRIFPLSAIPRRETMTVRIDGRLVAADDEEGMVWRYIEAIRSVVFEERAVPPSGSEVRVAYVVETGLQP